MKTTFETDGIIFSLLKQSDVNTTINGGIYVGDGRPEGSMKEDIVINSITLAQDYLPQYGSSNVNIYVPDKSIRIDDKEQLQADRRRLKELSDIVIAALRKANIEGLKIIITAQTVLEESQIKQHFVNIRIDWNIQIY